MSLEVVSFIFGAGLLASALIGGGLKLGAEWQVPPINRITRLVTGVLGVLFIVLAFWRTGLGPPSTNEASGLGQSNMAERVTATPTEPITTSDTSILTPSPTLSVAVTETLTPASPNQTPSSSQEVISTKTPILTQNPPAGVLELSPADFIRQVVLDGEEFFLDIRFGAVPSLPHVDGVRSQRIHPRVHVSGRR